MIPSKGVTVGEPEWSFGKNKVKPLKQGQLVSIHDLTMNFRVPKNKSGSSWKLGKGKNAVMIEHGFESRYHWVSEGEFRVPDKAKTFSAWIAPHQGSIYAFVYNSMFAHFLDRSQ